MSFEDLNQKIVEMTRNVSAATKQLTAMRVEAAAAEKDVQRATDAANSTSAGIKNGSPSGSLTIGTSFLGDPRTGPDAMMRLMASIDRETRR